MEVKVTPTNVRKGKTVILSKDLPTDRNFGNKSIIKEGNRGEIMSAGFEFGKLRVNFYSHHFENRIIEINELSAANFLTVDIF